MPLISYISPADATARLAAYGLSAGLSAGALGIASLRCDEEAPFFGRKLDALQERQFPRTFASIYNYSPLSPVGYVVGPQGSQSYAGARLLAYEGIIPEQVLDWVSLEAYRLVALTPERFVKSVGVGGEGNVSMTYDPSVPGLIDQYQQSLLLPFQTRHAQTRVRPIYPWL